MKSKLHLLSAGNSLINQYIAELRDTKIQSDRLRFRNNIRLIATFAGFEISKTLSYTNKLVKTPLGRVDCKVLKQQPVVGSVLRAGIAMHEGLLDVFNSADNAFIGAARQESTPGVISTNLSYTASPKLDGRTLIFSDPMLATGGSMQAALQALLKYGKPAKMHLVAVIASKQGVAQIMRKFPQADLWVGVIDPQLNRQFYIVPGLGDAGDLAYGEKL